MAIKLGSRTDFIDLDDFPTRIKILGMTQNHIVIGYTRSNHSRIICASISGLVPTFGSELSIYYQYFFNAITRLDDDYGVICVTRPGYAAKIYVFLRSLTTITLGSLQTPTQGHNYISLLRLDTNNFLYIGLTGTANTSVTIQQGTVNKAAKTISWGTQISSANHTKLASAVKADMFNSQYGVIKIGSHITTYKGIEQLELFSIIGGTITHGGWLDLSDTDDVYAMDVKCVSDTKFVVAVVSLNEDETTWDLKLKLFERTGIASINELDEIGIMTGFTGTAPFLSNVYQCFWVSLNFDGSSIISVFYYNKDDYKVYLETVKISGSSLTKDLNNYEVDDVLAFSSSMYLSMAKFSGVDSFAFAYDYLPTNYKGVVKIGNATYGSFTPKVMLI